MVKINLLLELFSIICLVISDPNPNFYIYLAFGQSNMEGKAEIETQDTVDVPQRFKMMAAVDIPSKGRIKGNWYTAIPPLCREDTGLTPCDYFGRELVSKLPEEITIGIINIAVAGCSIDMFDEDKSQNYLSTAPDWLKQIASLYGNHPYNVLVELGRKAKEEGVIYGVLLHQGETNTGDQNWPNNVKKIYDRLISDLGLESEKVPLLVGEVVNADSEGTCAYHNNIIANVPNIIPNSYFIKSNGLPSGGDGFHFSAQSYRELGKRYAQTALSILEKQKENEKIENNTDVNPQTNPHTNSSYHRSFNIGHLKSFILYIILLIFTI